MARASMERQVNGAMKGRSIFRDEKGSTTAGMAVALLVTLSLLFSAAQVYRIHAAGSEVQEVADAAACAALNRGRVHGGRARGRCRRAVTHASGGHCVRGRRRRPVRSAGGGVG